MRGLANNHSGSVLMETVLVLPLYLLLLGGLFIVGDIMLARFHLSAVERTYAWRGSSRVPGEPLRAPLLEMMPDRHLVENESKSAVVKHAGGVNNVANRFLHFVYANAKAVVKVPFWIGMANTQQTINPNDTGAPQFVDEYELHNGAVFGRSYVVVRRALNPGDRDEMTYYDRTQKAEKLYYDSIRADRQVLFPPSNEPGGDTRVEPFEMQPRNGVLLPLCE